MQGIRYANIIYLNFLSNQGKNNLSFKSYDGSKIFRGTEEDFGRCEGGGGWFRTV